MEKLFAVIEDNKVVNIIVGVEDEIVAANPGKYVDYTNGWDYDNGIDRGDFIPAIPSLDYLYEIGVVPENNAMIEARLAAEAEQEKLND